MALEMKVKCEKCGKGLKFDSEVCICSYECTFCSDCSLGLDYICPNCGGGLVKRPKRILN